MTHSQMQITTGLDEHLGVTLVFGLRELEVSLVYFSSAIICHKYDMGCSCKVHKWGERGLILPRLPIFG